jgi:hypothetical protein
VFSFSITLFIYLNRKGQCTPHSAQRQLKKSEGARITMRFICFYKKNSEYYTVVPNSSSFLTELERNNIKTMTHDFTSWLHSSFVHLLEMRWNRDCVRRQGFRSKETHLVQEALSVSQFFKNLLNRPMSQHNRDTSVGTVTGWIAENSGFDSRQMYEIFCPPQLTYRFLSSPSLLYNKHRRLFP